MKRKRSKRKRKNIVITVPKGFKGRTKIKEKKRSRKNPIVIEFGGEKRKYHIALGYRKGEKKNG